MTACNGTLSITQKHYSQLKQILFPGDNLEAVAFALCTRRQGENSVGFLVKEIIPVPCKLCQRAYDNVTWRTDIIPPILEHAANKNLSVVKIHSHPNGYESFSQTDDKSDKDFFGYIHAWLDDDLPHASLIMFPNGDMLGRFSFNCSHFIPLSSIKMVGDDLKFWFYKSWNPLIDGYGVRVAQTFGEGTYRALKRLKIGVVGCSGTGSIVIEQLARNCIGSLVLVDPDRIELKNLNRIIQATMEDAQQKRFKVDIIARHIEAMGFGTKVQPFPKDIYNHDIVSALAECDVLFGCMDSVDGRHLLNKLATTYLIPYFDIGVKLVADGNGGVEKVCGTVHYLQPGGSSLFSRGLYTYDQLRAASMKHSDPDSYEDQLDAGYIQGVVEEKPAVISVNMLIACLGVNELLARIHPFRDDPNSEYAIHTIGLNGGFLSHEKDGNPCDILKTWVGRGDVKPLLGIPSLSVQESPN